jgi:ABC-type glycerol-3-phosphate transport system substrate-binding protein
MLNRRLFLAGSASFASLPLLGGLAGCNQQQRLRLIGEDSSNLAAIRAVLPQFGERSGIETVADATDFTTLFTQANTDFANGSGRFDIVLQYNFSLSPYTRNRYVVTTEELKQSNPELDYSFEADLLPNVWRELGYYAQPPFTNFDNPVPIAYPFAANTMVLVYNKELLRKPAIAEALRRAFGKPFEIPRTWEELALAARAVREVNHDYYGIALQGASGGWLYYEWVNFLFGMGGKVMNKSYGWQSDLSTPLTLRSPQADQAAALYLSLRHANAGDFFSVDATKQRDLMLERDVAYAIMWTDYLPDLVKEEGVFGFAPIPGDKSMIAGGSFFVNRKSEKRAQATSLINYLLSRRIQKQMALQGLFPPTRPALQDTDVGTMAYMPAVRESLARGVYMLEAGPDSDLIQQEITSALQLAWRRRITPQEVASTATAAIAAKRPGL